MNVATGEVQTTSFTYDAAGRLLVKDGPLPGNGDAEYYRYDVLGRRTWEISAANASNVRLAKRYTYRDADDKVVLVETGTLGDPNSSALSVLNQSATTYDSRRNPVRDQVSSSGVTYGVTDRSFDDRGRLICQTTRMNLAALPTAGSDACSLGAAGSAGSDRITRRSYDAASQLLQVTKALGTADQADDATYSYTANGKVASLTDANGNVMTMGYDGFDRQVRWTFPSLSTPGQVNANDYEAYGYDAVGNRTSYRKRDGSTLGYSYDGLNRMLVKSVPSRAGLAATHTRSVYYGYDLQGKPTYARFDSTSGEGVMMAYDGFGRLASSTLAMDGTSRTLSYRYDATGARTRITHPDGTWFGYDRDTLGRLVTLRDQSGGDLLIQTFYDNGPRAWVGHYANGIGAGYDPVGRLTGYNLQYNNNGNVVADGTSLTYNPASQIVQRTLGNDAYAWSGAVNVDRSYATNGLNQYTAAGPASFTYDANGNLTSDGATRYQYDVENRLVSSSAGVNLRYDPLGRLWQVSGPSGTRQWLYDGDALVAEYDGSGNLQDRYVHGDGVDEPLLWYSGGGGAPRQLMADHQGSIVAVTQHGWSMVGINRYDEYGIPASGNIGRFQYTGQAWLGDLGMYYYKARIYSPTLGRFLQTDPIGYKDQINLYAYVANDPVNGRDPTGMVCGSLIPGHIGAGCSGESTLNILAAQSANALAPGQNQGNGGRGGVVSPHQNEPSTNDAGLPQSVEGEDIVVTAISANQSKPPKAAQHHCYEACYPILERWQPPGSDRNLVDFDKCMKICFAEYEKLRPKQNYTPIPDDRPKPFWYPYPRPWWFWWPPAIPGRPARN